MKSYKAISLVQLFFTIAYLLYEQPLLIYIVLGLEIAILLDLVYGDPKKQDQSSLSSETK